MLIKYPASNFDEDKVEGDGEDGNGNSQDMIADTEGEDDSDNDKNIDDDSKNCRKLPPAGPHSLNHLV